ncbi:MAG TPA: beta-phosphoglucomutase [Victivallales bacterium]|nr:beta-phosphoglucomutase [Victivallales bacterium]
MRKINTVIFDLDGVITDTAEFHFLAWKRVSQEENLYFDKSINENLKGVSRIDSLKIILNKNNREITAEKLKKLSERKNIYYLELINTVTPENLLPGICRILKFFKNKNINIALGSASKNARLVLNKLKIFDYFDLIGDGNCVINSKPAPDIFLYCAKQLGVFPENCIVIEDAEAGIEAAKQAGMKTVGIGSREKLNKADYIYFSPADIDLNIIIK